MSQTAVLSVDNIHKKYNEGKSNEVYVLKGIDFSIPPGQMTAIMGPSGCGKTTLLNLIGGLDETSDGNIMIEGNSIIDMDDNTLTNFRRDNVGYIFQLFNLFDDQTSVENVSLPLLLQNVNPKEAVTAAEMLLQEVGLGDRFNDVPGNLSGGEQQKVAIARTLVTSPRIILADEPTGDLDIATSDDIMALFRRMQEENQGMAVIIVTHSSRIANQCDRIIRIENGTVFSDTEVAAK
ncbi:MAG: Macrolide export ATP-binding/permease protein MacB [Candidatus Heimdallarchaeota archaeon LC_2]|nr:MAG: Macrolide export ATP-binding/permease protein MacB [Candidatus Heimdallarchaeota archaeon LC_2]